MRAGQIINVSVPVRFFNDTGSTYWGTGNALVLDTNEYDVTLLFGEDVLYASWDSLSYVIEDIEYVS
jgi:hypothetical protein